MFQELIRNTPKTIILLIRLKHFFLNVSCITLHVAMMLMSSRTENIGQTHHFQLKTMATAYKDTKMVF